MANTSFSSQGINLSSGKGASFFPEGFENIFLGLYFIFVPYLTGLLFMFFYVAGSEIELLSSISKAESSIFLTWIIGYEVVAGIMLGVIFLMAIKFTPKDDNGKKVFIRP